MAGNRSSSLHGGIQPATSSQVCSDLAGLGTKPRNQGSAYEYATLRVEESSWPMTPPGSRCNRHIVGPAILDAESIESASADGAHLEVRGHWRRPTSGCNRTDRILHCASLRLSGQPSCGRIAWASKGQYEIGLARLKFRFLRTPLRDLRGLAQHYQNDESIQTLIRRSSMRVRSSCVCKIAPCHRALLACGNGLPPRCTGVDLRVRLETKKTRRHHRVG